PTKSPTESPTLFPTANPSEVPSLQPSNPPSVSAEPSTQPSIHPTTKPSISPTKSAMPTVAPSLQPSPKPSSSPSISQEPTFSPSSHIQPSIVPTLKPSQVPSVSPFGAPSVSPTTYPSQQPTESLPPSESPTEEKIVASSIIINQPKSRKSTPLLIVGACCFVVMASTSLYLYKRGSQSRLDNSSRAPTMIEVSTGKDSNHGAGMISPYSIEDGLGRQAFDVNYTDSESRASEEDTLDFSKAHGDMVDIDLETGRIGIDSIPNSVSIIKQTQLSSGGENNNLANIIDQHEAPESPGYSKLRMPKSVYVPKMFQRSKEGDDNNKKQIITWNQIRDEGRSPCSSGYAPASVPSPMLSPFFVKGLSNILPPNISGVGKKGILMTEPSSNETLAVVAVDTQEKSSSKQSARKGKRRGVTKSPVKEILVKIDAPGGSDDKASSERGGKRSHDEQKSPKTIGSKSSDGSSIEWGIDVSKVEPSRASFEANMTELKNLLVSIKTLGSSEAPEVPAAEDPDVQMTYTDDSSEAIHSAGNQLSGQISPNSDASTFMGDIDIAPIESASTQDNASSSSAQSLGSHGHTSPSPHQITFGKELLNANRMSEEGTFNFRNIFADPKNDLYECHAPSGPLGIVVDTTPLGPRVRSLNPLSPIFGKISPGDVIVGVDEEDTVGVEAGDFWQVVSRKASQQVRILTILRI
ncbi:hypothetical protein ACHAXR_011931, partial [Thalassiosira sp. AJA248-18]